MLQLRKDRRNAASVATLLLTTDATVSEIKEREDKKGGHGHSHGGMGM